MKLLFISDLHIGNLSPADDFGDNDDKLLQWIDKINPDETYLVGDTKERGQFSNRSIKKAHPKMCDLFKIKTMHKLIGNHDYKDVGKSVVKIKLPSGKKVFISHGHQGDPGMSNLFLKVFVKFLGVIERIPFMSWVDNPEQLSKKPNRADYKTEKYAIKLLKKYDIVICGHTHKKLIKEYPGEFYKKIYANCGHCMYGKFEGLLLDTDTEELKMV